VRQPYQLQLLQVPIVGLIPPLGQHQKPNLYDLGFEKVVTGQRSNQLSYVPSFFSSTYAKSKNLLSIAAVYLFSRFHLFHGI
jgi:hypothetical protein